MPRTLASFLLAALAAIFAACSQPPAPSREAAVRTVSEVEASGAAAVARYSDQALVRQGFLDITKAPYSADPTGEADATAAIQQAIRDARDARLIAWLPPGRYRVSDTIEGTIGVVDWDDWPFDGTADPWEAEASFEYPCVLTGSAGDKRTVLVLADNAPGFDDPENPKPVLYFWARSMQVAAYGTTPRDPDIPQSNINFNQKILHLDVELGAGNSGAVGIDHRGAEGATVEDVNVQATGAFAGFRNAPGSGGAMHGIRVTGGRYGLYLTGTQPSPLISDVKLTGQTEASIYATPRGPLTLAGAEIDGPGIQLGMPDRYFDGTLNIVDSVIRLSGNAPAVATPRSAVLDNVWIENAATALEIADAPPVEGNPNGWTHIARYAAGGPVTLSKEFGEKPWRDTVWVNRKQQSEPVAEVNRTAAAPSAELLARHSFPETPSVEELLAASVFAETCGARGDGVADDAPSIQRCLDSQDLVYLPKGRFRISAPLRLRDGVQLIGASNIITVVEPDNDSEAYQDPSNPQPLIETVDDAAANPLVANLRLHVPVKQACVYGLCWRAGRNSVVRNIYPSRDLWHPDAPVMNHAMLRIEGNGGGRWYTQTMLGQWSQGPDFRFLLAEGTREPLTFYHLQPQFARGTAMIEFRNTENVDVFSMKSEGDFTMLWINNSRRVRVFGHNGFHMAALGWAVVRVDDSREITLTNLQPMVLRVGYYFGHLINFDPERWYILSDGPFKAKGLEQLAYYRLD